MLPLVARRLGLSSTQPSAVSTKMMSRRIFLLRAQGSPKRIISIFRKRYLDACFRLWKSAPKV